MPALKSSFLDKILGRIDRLNAEGLQTALQRLARERSFLEMLFNAIEDGVIVVNPQGHILYSNQAATHLIGLPEDLPEDQPVTRFLPGLNWDQLSRPDASGMRQVARHEFEVNYPRPRFLRLYAAPLEGGKGSPGMALILHDATEARQQTFEAIESERLQALTLLAASVAHEIGNPLNALNIHAQLMERELKKLRLILAGGPETGGAFKTAIRRARAPKAPAETLQIISQMDQFLGVAKGEITRLDYIITQFLQAIRPTPMRLQVVSLNEVVHGALELLLPELENRGLLVSEKCDHTLPLAPLDPAQIKQVLVNLIKNAMQAMNKGGELTVRTGHDADTVWFSVADTGGGMPQEIIKRLFEPFYTTKAKGTGLGLMIVQRIVREHRGRIEVESRVGLGTTFRVRLPLREPAPRLLEARLHD